MPTSSLGHDENAHDDEYQKSRRRGEAPNPEPAVIRWLVQKIAQGRAERTGEDEGGPEEQGT
jgi:hypothetical protein